MSEIKKIEGQKRVVIENVQPQIDKGLFPVKRVIGEKVIVRADIYADGHDRIDAELLYRHQSSEDWERAEMKYVINDEWQGAFIVDETGYYYFTVCGWVDHFATWRTDIKKKLDAGQDISVDLKIGAMLLKNMGQNARDEDVKQIKDLEDILNEGVDAEAAVEAVAGNKIKRIAREYSDKLNMTKYSLELPVHVSRKKALFSSWYEFFPRSFGSFAECERLLPEIIKMGFDVVYLPPIHPIGETKRKGKNNSVVCLAGEPGSPWAIGSANGGHKSINSELGDFNDFERFVRRANELEIEVALDLAFQCSPDHPYVREHPQWFKWRPDNTVQFAENPPKRYEDILPLNFETDDWQNLWNELKSVVLFWIEKGIRIFRVDNPHTKPFVFWEWLLSEIKRDYPEVLFLSEAFTRPKPMQRLAKIDFDQSYSYFTWRNTKYELVQYLTELTQTELAEYMRPNFWPNTPDILPQYLQYGGRSAFVIRYVLAATMSSNCGIYGPAYELCINEAVEEREEYFNAEKYEIKKWDWNKSGNIREFIGRVNKCRRENKSLQETRNLRFIDINNEMMISYYKATEDFSNVIIVIVNLDPLHKQADSLSLPIHEFGIPENQTYLLNDLISNDKFIRQGSWNYIELDPHLVPVHIFRLQKRLRREYDFDYFM